MNRIIVTDKKVVVLRRPVAAPQVAIPFGARSVGHGCFPPGAFEDNGHHHWAKIMCGIAGRAEMRFGGRDLIFEPGHIAVFLPGALHRARALEEGWEVRWWTIDGHLAPQVLEGFGYTREGIYEGEVPSVAHFVALYEALSDITPAGEYRAGAMAYEMFCIAARRARPPARDPVVAEAVSRIQQAWSDPDFGVARLARELGLHRSVLSRRFKVETGVSPCDYLIRFRIQRAAALLRQSELPVKEIARRCGYPDAGYFTRLFRRLQGVTPGRSRARN